jgi:peptide/nickel transport system permease protein
MGRYVARRLLQTIPVIILVSIAVFAMIRSIPGDPAAVLLGPDVPPEQIIQMRAKMGLDQPIWLQYFIWLGDMLRGNFGNSYLNGFPVSELILRKLPATIQLALAGMVVAMVISIPLGIVSALWRGHWPDRFATFYNSLALGMPSFWLGILLVLIFALKLRVLPPSGYPRSGDGLVKGLRFIILPAFTLGIYISAIFARFIKSSILETLHQDYVRTAYSKGLSKRSVVLNHVLKNALIPVVTVFGIQFGGLLGGAVITESIFDWPGLGRLLVQSILARDYSIVQALILLAVTVYLVVNLFTDLLYGVIDPRVHRE